MSFDIYTQNITLTQKAKFWTNYISALKGQSFMLLWLPLFLTFEMCCRPGGSVCCRRGGVPSVLSFNLGDSSLRVQGPQEGDWQDRGPDALQEERNHPSHPCPSWRSRQVNHPRQTYHIGVVLTFYFEGSLAEASLMNHSTAKSTEPSRPGLPGFHKK